MDEVEYEAQRAEWEQTHTADMTVTEHDIAELIGSITGIPVNRMLEGEAEKLLHMEEALHHRVVGQEQLPDAAGVSPAGSARIALPLV